MRTLVSPGKVLIAIALFLAAALSASAAVTVNVSSPSSSSVNTSFTLQANASSSSMITGWWIYVDGNDYWNTPGPTSSISVPVALSAGTHSITVKAWDSTGANGSMAFSVTASTSTPASSTSPSGITVSIQSPANGAGVSSPVTFSATGASPNGIGGWVIYVDDQNAYQVNNYSNSLSASVSLGGGSHSFYIRAWDRLGGYGTSPTYTINVGGSSTSSGSLPTPPPTAVVWTNLEETTDNWSACSDCAGGGSSTTNYWKAFWQSSPSMDGASLQFYNGGEPWANVLWIKKLGNQSQATNFLYDLYVYFDPTTAANLWAAEYDVWQSVGGYEFMIGTQCNFGNGEWDIWDQANGRWVQTSVPCMRMSAGNWHHIQMYLQRLSGNRYFYNTLVVDGTPYSLNQTFYAGWSGWSDDLGIQWQLDLGANGADAHQWVDNVKLSIW